MWWNESLKHAKAAKGIKTKAQPPNKYQTGTANKTALKHKLDDNIQNDMHSIDKIIRKMCATNDIEKAQKMAKEAEKIYTRLGGKFRDYGDKYGQMPHWVNYTWHGKENFNGSGKVKQQLNIIKNCKPDELRNKQSQLYQIIKLPKDKTFTEVNKA